MSLDIDLIACDQDGNEILAHDANITHNLGPMAEAAGIYKALWRPEECGVSKACDLIVPLTLGVAKMESEPDAYRAHDSPNGWGLYDNFLPWLKELLAACQKYPSAKVYVSR